jgi:hypothetical protein
MGISGSTAVYCTAFGLNNCEIKIFIKPAIPNLPNLTRAEYGYVEAAPIRPLLRDRMTLLT